MPFYFFFRTFYFSSSLFCPHPFPTQSSPTPTPIHNFVYLCFIYFFYGDVCSLFAVVLLLFLLYFVVAFFIGCILLFTCFCFKSKIKLL